MNNKNRLAFSFLITWVCTCFLAVIIGLTSNPTPAKADVIYHAFDECFANIQAKLPEIKEAGYTHIQISPPYKTPPRQDNPCASVKEWSNHYQPFDYVVDGNLGNEKGLKNLIDAAHDSGIKIIVDVIFNHMANYDRYYKAKDKDVQFPAGAYPIFNDKKYFHEKHCIEDEDYKDPYKVENYWLCTHSDPEGLPDLKTELPYVQEQARKYLQKLLVLGADGFRFDTVKHVPVEDWKEIVKDLKSKDTFYYGEVIGDNYDQSMKYVPVFPKVTDFQLVNTLKSAFGYGGDLRSLVNPADTQRALPGDDAVTFSRNHDTWASGQFDYLKFDKNDLVLATAYVLGRKEGTPLILTFDAFEPTVVAGTKFHEQMMGESQYYRNGNEIAVAADNPNLLFIERGDKGLTIINKAAETFDVTAAKMPGLGVGCYSELQYDFEMCVDYGGDGQKYINKWGSPNRGGINIGPRTALFFVKNEA
ncbi:MAG: alpha-amylase [Okeania sp. SIO3B5]|uniref:alpha-amylase family glycosyl hydrolase n=1 Tax=Okeania sp. SIO3B5 TaxID=2607811 RepID=UPI0014018E28|nr:alpha-amylase family glycosyl hydrolase [Okeania sp. SIO3B5]NEO54877.1 alpha-amylase [Okeania sp. SIO3B5]